MKSNVVIRLINIGYMGAVAVDSSREKVSIMPRNGGALYTASREMCIRDRVNPTIIG